MQATNAYVIHFRLPYILTEVYEMDHLMYILHAIHSDRQT